MKLLLGLILALGCTLFGLSQGNLVQKKERCLAAVLEALQYIRVELTERATPVPDIFSELAKTCRPVLREFFSELCWKMDGIGNERLASIWQETILESATLLLSENQRLELCRPGQSLGKYEASEQAAAINVCVSRLELEYERAVEKTRQSKRLYTGLGLTVGLMVAVVLL